MSNRQEVAAGRSGFTLLEVLVAVALSSVIMMALFGLFDAVGQVASGVRTHEAESYGELVLESILFEDLRSIYYGAGSAFSFSGNSGTSFGAEGALMSFCSTASLGSGRESSAFSLQRVEYVLKGDGDKKTLIRREKRYCGVGGNWDWLEVPLANGISGMSFEYFNRNDNTFVTEWESSSPPPGAVKVTVEYANRQDQVFVVELSFMALGEIVP